MTKPRNQIDASLTELLDGQESSVENVSHIEHSGDIDIQLELADARAGQNLLKQLTPRPVASHFERRVQQRVRRRTGGRYFGQPTTPFGFGVTIDAFVVLAVAIMAACWFLTHNPTTGETLFPDPPHTEVKRIP
jgi:hypothetical protein